MHKYLIILIIYIVCASGCDKGWTTTEREHFLKDCQESQGTEKICRCILVCLETSYDNYNLALENLEKSEISKSLEQCLSSCQ